MIWTKWLRWQSLLRAAAMGALLVMGLPPETITAQSGWGVGDRYVTLNGEPRFLNGVNYVPSQDWHMFLEHWDPAAVEFAYYDAYIHKGTFLPVVIEYYDRTETKYRVYKALEVQRIGGYPTVMKSSMSNLKTGGTTVASYSDVGYDLGFPEEIFSERFLRRAPTQYLR